MQDVRLETADGQLEYVRNLLASNHLPADDVRSGPGEFYVATVDGTRVGCGGLEVYESDGLLRSVVVAEAHRGAGYGAAITDALESRARASGVETLYLLTTTAADFFAARGYEPMERSAVPDAIEDTTEFAEYCPSSAACLHKRVVSDGASD